MIPDHDVPKNGIDKRPFDNIHFERQIGCLKGLAQIRQRVQGQWGGVRQRQIEIGKGLQVLAVNPRTERPDLVPRNDPLEYRENGLSISRIQVHR